MINEQALLHAATMNWINDLAAQGVLITDVELKICSWNHWLELHSGRAAADVLGRSVLEVFPALVTRRLDQSYQDALAGQVQVLAQSLHRYLLPLRPTPGHAKFDWMQQSARIAPLLVDGQIVGTLTVIDDVTERVAREAELRTQIAALEELQQALRRSEKWLSTTLHSIGDAVIATNLQSQVVLMNDVAQSLTGWTEAEALGQPLAEVFQIIHPETRQRMTDPVVAALRQDPVCSQTHDPLIVARHGVERPIDDSAAPITDEHGDVIGAVLIFRDITERKQAEQEIERRYLDGLKLTETNRRLVGALEFDQVTEIVCAAARELTGADGATFVLRDGAQVHYVAENAIEPLWLGQTFPIECCISGWSMLHQQPAVIEDVSADARIPADVYGATFIRSLLIMPVGPGMPVASIGVYWARQHRARDYEVELIRTLASAAGLALASVRAYEETRQARLQAEQANRLKDEFLATLSHELRNPLNSIVGNTQILLRSPEATEVPVVQRAAKIIHRNASSQIQLINDLLDLSRLHNGKLLLNRLPTKLVPVISDAAEAVRAQAEARKIVLQINLPDESLVVDADPVRIQQIVWNLLSNAVKFTPNEGQVSLHLSQMSGRAILTVADTGQGIDAAFLPHIFEMFRQADARTTRQYGGLGIGLALVKQLAELHGGSIQAQSAGTGCGAQFTLRLPLVTAAQPVAAVDARSTQGGLQGARILIVDDSPDSLEMLNLLLEAEGAEVRTAAGGQAALQIAETADFDLIISDISMPEMDGYEMLARMRAAGRLAAVPAIALTGFGRPEDVARARTAGFTSHLTKPLDFDYLIELARTALRHPLPARGEPALNGRVATLQTEDR
jgi:PAS domain S-box-containing protein